MASIRTIFILWMIYSTVVIVDSNYKGRRPGEAADPAGVDIEDLSVVLKDGEETVAEEKAIDRKLDELDRRRPNDTSLKIEAKLQGNQKKIEEEKLGNETKSSTDSVEMSKRYIEDIKGRQWPKAIIPYVMRHKNLTQYHKNKIKIVMALYEHYTCFRFVEWDNTTKTKYGLGHNNYIRFVKGTGCWSYLGNLRKKVGGQGLSCCTGGACVHEIGHAIGFHHEQKSPFSKDILRVNTQNIKSKYVGQFTRNTNTANLHDFPYDLNSVMHYGFGAFNNGNGPTMTVYNPKLKYLVDVGSLAHFYFFKELSIVYKCKELKCPDFKMKCENDGYVAYIAGKCRCRCPTGLDPETGCTTVKSNNLDNTLKWPSSKFALLRPANASCPEDSEEGSLTHKSDGGFTNDNYQAMGDHENLHFCTFDHVNRSGDAKLWPNGEYCLTKAGGSCPKSDCPFGWKLNEQTRHCYKAFSNKVKGYNGGADFCKKHKAYIVKIEDADENDFVRKLINSNSYIGANDMKTETVFAGYDGKELKYQNWNKDQPDNGNSKEDCVIMYRRRGKWNDINCGNKKPVVCEMSLPEFKEGYIEFEDDSVAHQGSLPDVMSGGKTKLEFCCRDDGNNVVPVVMPTATKFILWQTNRDGCQRVKDTIGVSNHFAYRTKPGKITIMNGTTPLGSIQDNLAYAYFCVYQPVSKDCGQIIELTDENPAVIVTSPYYPHSYHANMQCTWLIKSKKNTRIVLSFETFEIPYQGTSCDDSLEVRYGLPAQPGRKFCGKIFKSSVYSFENYMSLILNSKSYLHGKKFKGTVTMIRDEDQCYYGPDKGASYRGKVNFSRNFKTCLPWNKTTHCVHSPNNADDALSGLDGNYCRNPNSGTHPWCYTESKGCIRDYCDVCGLGNCHDYYGNCADRLTNDPNYCKNTTAWNGITGCAKTCGLCDRQTKKKYAELSCTNPPIPENAVLVDQNASTTQVGKTVKYYYPINMNNIFAFICYSDGSWSKPSECPFGWKLDPNTKKCNKAFKKVVNQRYFGDVLCRKHDGYLGVIANAKENAFVKKLVKATGRKTLIDLTDRVKEKKHVWTNGETSTYRNWNTGEPNNWNNQDCTLITTSGKWEDATCETPFFGVLCQIPLPVSYCKDGTTQCEYFRKLKNVAVGKPSKQSTTYSSATKSVNAVDGDVTGGISHTRFENRPWLEIDLESVYKVTKVLIVNRHSHGWRLNSLRITIGEQQSNMRQCVFYQGPGKDGEYIELQCTSPLFGRYVKLQVMVPTYLQLKEVFVYAYTDVPVASCPKPSLPLNAVPVGELLPSYTAGNVTRYYFDVNKNNMFTLTCLSSGNWTKVQECPDGWTMNSATKTCNKVIKQTFTGRYKGDLLCRQYSGYVATINDQAENEFMQILVNAAATKALIDATDKLTENTWVNSNGEAVNYVNWGSGEPNNLNNQDCTVLNPNGKWWDLGCQKTFYAVACEIAIPVSTCEDGTTKCDKFMTLENVALGKPVNQSSTYSTNEAELAVDGQLTRFTHTQNDASPWWQVDLKKVFPINTILIVNRMQSHGTRLRNLKVTVGETEDDMKDCVFYEGPGESSEYIELRCTTPLSGQFVKLQMTTAGFLQLTEVYVYTPASDID